MTEAQHVPSILPTLREDPPRDAVLGQLAARQHGVVALDQLRSLGLTGSAVRDRVVAGRLHRVHRGVYAVGHPRLAHHGRWMGAVLACGRRAVLSHRSAAALWGLRPDSRAKADVSLPSKSVRQRRGIEVHAAATLREADATECDGVPCTTVARTLVDLADVAERRSVERAIEQADLLHLFDLRALEKALGSAGPRRGVGVVRAVLEDRRPSGLTASELEERFVALCHRARLPDPEVNAWLALADGAVKTDFLWRAQRFVVETDGHAFYSTPEAFERDRRRDQRLKLAGYEVVRLTWRQVVRDGEQTARAIRKLLARR